MNDGPNPRPTDVAVIGLHGRFPGAGDTGEFWNRLRAGEDTITFLSDEELIAAGVPASLVDDPRYVKGGGVLPDPFHFDHEFFGYTRREAELMDPQQRLFLEVAAELLDTIGYGGGSAEAGRQCIGVFGGASMNTYLTNVVARTTDLLSVEGTEIMLTNDKDYLPTRVSYKLGLTGPSVNVQSGCSTSLVAVHLAVQSLLNGECDIALAGGVSVHVGPHPGYLYQAGMMFSPDGRCRAFDEQAAGTSFGDGVGIVALKRLVEAIEDGDDVLAVVKGTAVKNDGSAKVGYTAPGVDGQLRTIVEAQAVAEVDAASIGYLEAHGTGTALGDPVEFAALREAFIGVPRGTCALGTVKANIGHLAAAAGIAGFIKTVLALKHREIPPHPHFIRPHPALDLAESPFYVNSRLVPWPDGPGPRRAGVSSFGVGGTNAHVILEEAPVRAATPGDGSWQLLTVSAKTAKGLRHARTRLADHLDATMPQIADVAYTLRVGRREFAHRYAAVCAHPAQAATRLRADDAAAPPVASPAPVALLLTGSGAGATLELPPVRERNRRSLDVLTGLCGREAGPDVVARDVAVAGFVAEHALATLWLDSGVRPSALIGSGAGELLAACLAGVLDLESGLALVAWHAGLIATPPDLRPRTPEIPVVSAVTGAPLGDRRLLDPHHWLVDIWGGTRLAEAIAAGTDEAGVLLVLGEPGPDGPAGVARREPPACAELPRVVRSLGDRGDTRPVSATLLAAAGQLWTAGVPVDWTGWHPRQPRRRVPLPPHPLDRQHLSLRSAGAHAGPRRAGGPADWIYAESWQRVGRAPAPVLPDGPWLVFADREGVAEALVGLLRARGIETIVVRQGRSFGRVERGVFALDPADPAGYPALFAALRADGPLPGYVVHCWSVDGDPTSLDAEDVEREQERGFHSLIEAAKAAAEQLAGTPAGGGVQLAVVSRHLHDVLGGEPVAPAKRMVTAAARVIQQEFGRLSCQCVDLGDEPVSSGNAALLLAELMAATGGAVALRRGHRWIQRFVPVGRDQFPPAGRTSLLRPGGVYLITGGLGEIGLALAGHLARTVGAKLVLTGRSAFPEPDDFDAWTQRHGPGDPVSAKIDRVRTIAASAGGLLTASADVTDREQMAKLIAAVRARFGRIDGWFHAAGVPLTRADRWIGQADRVALREIMAPKVLGALVLEELFADEPADFGCLVSSLASVVGGVGYAGYAAANSFLDALAQGRPDRLSIDWEGWDIPNAAPVGGSRSGTWHEVRQLALTVQQGTEVFDLALRHADHRRLAVSTVDLDARVRHWAGHRAEETGATRRSATPADVTGLAEGEFRERIAGLWSEVLRVELDRYDQSIFELGGDSLLLVQLAIRLEEALGVPVGATDLLAAPTIDHLAARLRARLGPAGGPGDRADVDDDMAEAADRANRRARGRAGRTGG